MTDPHDEPRIPEPLRRDLVRSFGPRVPVPAAIEAGLQLAAQRHLRRRRPWLWVTAASAAAAAAAVLLLVPQAVQSRLPLPAEPPQVAREDFDGDGRVDVVDAWRLVLALRRGAAVAQAFDLDGDGVVDARDADRIALRAVTLHG